jgi:periplasmic protein TonB
MRLYTIVVSIAAHAAVLVVVVIVPLAAMDALPRIHVVPEFIRVTQVQLPELPPPPRSRTAPAASSAVDNTAAPITAPETIAPEAAPPGPAYDGPPGVPHGDGPGVVVLGPTLPIPPPPATAQPVRPGGDIRPPAKTKHVAPMYPSIARQNRIQGTVVLEAIISEEGRVRDVRIVHSIQLLDNAAIDAVRQWEFTPTLLNGQRVPVLLTVRVAFVLN